MYEGATVHQFSYNLKTERVHVAIALYARNREMLGSNLGQNTGYPEGFRGFPQSSHVKADLVTPEELPSKSLPVHPSSTILQFYAVKLTAVSVTT
jgi:hypothetical protein